MFLLSKVCYDRWSKKKNLRFAWKQSSVSILHFCQHGVENYLICIVLRNIPKANKMHYSLKTSVFVVLTKKTYSIWHDLNLQILLCRFAVLSLVHTTNIRADESHFLTGIPSPSTAKTIITLLIGCLKNLFLHSLSSCSLFVDSLPPLIN